MKEKTLSDILEGFGQKTTEVTQNAKGVCFITVRISPDAKARYDRLQEQSGKRFSKKVRETIIALMDVAETRTA